MMKEDDPRACVSIKYRQRKTAILILIDGRIEFANLECAYAFIKRERLNVVSRRALRALANTFIPVASFVSLLQSPSGHDDEDVNAWKQVAKLQERFRVHGDGWAWWCRFQSVNSAETCRDIIRMLFRLAAGNPTELHGGLPIDWLALLREAVAEVSSANVDRLRTAISRELTERSDG